MQDKPSARRESTTSSDAPSTENIKSDETGKKHIDWSDPEQVREYHRNWARSNPEKVRVYRDKRRLTSADYSREWRLNNPEKMMLQNAKRRARIGGYPFSLTEKDIVIPPVCPLLGIPLYLRSGKAYHPNSPSLDKLVPALGYVPGNVVVISHRANTIKHNATLQELKDLTKNLEKILDERTHIRKGTT